jgi:NTP pyrophosphatase (non-canonical NTP hydrolase)
MARPVVNRWDGARELRAGPAPVSVGSAGVHLDELQRLMEQTYGLRDTERGVAATIAWLTEELGELAQAVRKGTREQQLHELGDVLAWLASLSAQLGLSMSEAVARYAGGCPACGAAPCECPDASIPT